MFGLRLLLAIPSVSIMKSLLHLLRSEGEHCFKHNQLVSTAHCSFTNNFIFPVDEVATMDVSEFETAFEAENCGVCSNVFATSWADERVH